MRATAFLSMATALFSMSPVWANSPDPLIPEMFKVASEGSFSGTYYPDPSQFKDLFKERFLRESFSAVETIRYISEDPAVTKRKKEAAAKARIKQACDKSPAEDQQLADAILHADELVVKNLKKLERIADEFGVDKSIGESGPLEIKRFLKPDGSFDYPRLETYLRILLTECQLGRANPYRGDKYKKTCGPALNSYGLVDPESEGSDEGNVRLRAWALLTSGVFNPHTQQFASPAKMMAACEKYTNHGVRRIEKSVAGLYICIMATVLQTAKYNDDIGQYEVGYKGELLRREMSPGTQACLAVRADEAQKNKLRKVNLNELLKENGESSRKNAATFESMQRIVPSKFIKLTRKTEVPDDWRTCSYGGTKVEIGLDLNFDQILEASEVLDTTFECRARADHSQDAN